MRRDQRINSPSFAKPTEVIRLRDEGNSSPTQITCFEDPCTKFRSDISQCKSQPYHHNPPLSHPDTFAMGWLWSSPSEAAPSSAQENTTSSPQSAAAPPAAPDHQTSSKPLTREELAEKELQSFLQEIEADTRPSSTKYNRVPRQPPSPNSSPNDEPLSEQLLPRTMSCREAFDAAFYCNSLGGQFNNLYRYGTVRSCSENWSDFWFCMRTRTLGDKEKEEAIKARYREKEKRRYGRDEIGKSSEDVWKSREKKMEWGEAFNTPFPDLPANDEEWNRMERERRARVQGGTIS